MQLSGQTLVEQDKAPKLSSQLHIQTKHSPSLWGKTTVLTFADLCGSFSVNSFLKSPVHTEKRGKEKQTPCWDDKPAATAAGGRMKQSPKSRSVTARWLLSWLLTILLGSFVCSWTSHQWVNSRHLLSYLEDGVYENHASASFVEFQC